ncbi:zinc-binding dehydrogenase [Rhodococcus sp. ACS1]|uniref:zinc-binding dehydrogenase n=1 Tax=Rhodococcus sp. ACS1 TaxID=2028570 RepID=UPI00211CC11D|nr:zinc-binding dehydrogenase [Rhodococcus sp. ACS1]
MLARSRGTQTTPEPTEEATASTPPHLGESPRRSRGLRGCGRTGRALPGLRLFNCDTALPRLSGDPGGLGGSSGNKSLSVLKPGGKITSISGPPDPSFAKEAGLNWIVQQAMRLLSFRIRRAAKRRKVTYSFLFMKSSGDQLRQLASLIDAGTIRPVIDQIFPLESTKDALTYVEQVRAQGKVVVKVG